MGRGLAVAIAFRLGNAVDDPGDGEDGGLDPDVMAAALVPVAVAVGVEVDVDSAGPFRRHLIIGDCGIPGVQAVFISHDLDFSAFGNVHVHQLPFRVGVPLEAAGLGGLPLVHRTHQIVSVLIQGRSGVGGDIIRVAGDADRLGIPAGEGVAVVAVVRLRGGGAGEGGHLAVGHRGILKLRAVLIQETDRVLIHYGIINRGVGRVAADRHNRGIPAGEGVSVLGGSGLCRRLALVDRQLTVGHLAFLQHRAVLVHKPDRIGPDRLRKGGSVGHVAGDRLNSGRPADEGVAVLGVCGLGGRRTVILGHHAIGHIFILFQLRPVIVDPGNGVGVGILGEGGNVFRVAGDRRHVGRPAREHVAVLGVSVLDRCCAVIGRHSTVGHVLVGFQHRAVLVLPGDGVGIEGLAEQGGVSGVAGDSRDFRRPAGEGVGILGGGRLDGIWVGRDRAVLVFLRGLHAVDDPGDGVLVEGLFELGGIGDVSGNRGDFRRPAGKGIAVLGVAGLGGGFAVEDRRLAVGNVPVGLQHCAVLVLPGDGVGVYRLLEVGVIADVLEGSGEGFIGVDRLVCFPGPTVEGVGVLGVCFLDRRVADVCRLLALLYPDRLNRSLVALVQPEFHRIGRRNKDHAVMPVGAAVSVGAEIDGLLPRVIFVHTVIIIGAARIPGHVAVFILDDLEPVSFLERQLDHVLLIVGRIKRKGIRAGIPVFHAVDDADHVIAVLHRGGFVAPNAVVIGDFRPCGFSGGLIICAVGIPEFCRGGRNCLCFTIGVVPLICVGIAGRSLDYLRHTGSLRGYDACTGLSCKQAAIHNQFAVYVDCSALSYVCTKL